MAIYIYKHPNEESYVEVVQGMNDEHVWHDNDGLQWKRVFTLPNMAMDIQKGDPYNQNDYLKATNKSCTIGDMLDLSAELSEERKEKDGEDPIKRAHFDKYEKKNKVKHAADKPDKIETKHFDIDFTK